MATTSKQSIKEKITDRFCAIFESNMPIDFQLGWYSIPAANAVSGRIYRGIYNKLFLSVASQVNGYENSLWMTFKQAEKLGANVRGAKGKGVGIGAFGTYSKKEFEVDKNGDKSVEFKSAWFMKGYTVFNVAEVNDLPKSFSDKIEKVSPRLEFRVNPGAEALLSKMQNPPTIEHGGEMACYIPSLDSIKIPFKTKFRTSGEYYAALFHELIHSTLHSSRLNRKHGPQGTAEYAREELIAVMGSAMAADVAGVEFDYSGWADYMRSYCPELRSNPNLLFRASKEAERAVNFIFGLNEFAPNVESVAA